MVSVLDVVLAIGGHLLALGVVGVSLYRHSFRRYLYLNLYAIALLVVDLLRYVVLNAYGFKSMYYFWAFYLSDALLSVLLYLLILSFFDVVFSESSLRETVRISLLGAFALLSFISYISISSSVKQFYSRLTIEFQQNMYFASVVLAVLLCMSLAYLRVRNPQLSMLIGGLGVLATLQAASYALQNIILAKSFGEVVRLMSAISTAAMLGIWCYALAKLPTTSPATAKHAQPTLQPAWSAAEGPR